MVIPMSVRAKVHTNVFKNIQKQCKARVECAECALSAGAEMRRVSCSHYHCPLLEYSVMREVKFSDFAT